LRRPTKQKATIRVSEAGSRACVAGFRARALGLCAQPDGVCDLATGFCANHGREAIQSFLYVPFMFFSFSYTSPSPYFSIRHEEE